jgi:hypothetical protein
MSPIGVIGQRPAIDRKIEKRKTQSRIAQLVCGQQAVQRILSVGFPPGLGPPRSGLPITINRHKLMETDAMVWVVP